MAQLLSGVYVHVIFSTRAQDPWLDDPEVVPIAYRHMHTALKDKGCEVFALNGTPNHVHIACSLPDTVTIANLVNTAKKVSGDWLRDSARYRGFHWQKGFAGLSFSPAELGHWQRYINAQQLHHKIQSFEDEYREFLAKYDLPCDTDDIFE